MELPIFLMQQPALLYVLQPNSEIRHLSFAKAVRMVAKLVSVDL
jgi:hypothetical protein